MKLSERLSAWANHVANDEYEICIEAADLLEECERALEAIIEDQATGGGDDTFPIAKTLLAKLRGQERGEHSFALEILQAQRHKESKQ